MFETLKAYCDSFLDYGLPGFDIIVYQGGRCVLRHMNGYSDFEKQIPMNGKERYNIYSCTKVITCTAALMLWEKGLFSLDDKLSDYMPEFEHMSVQTEDGLKEAENPILIRHLFQMTAGFSYNTGSPNLKQCGIDTNGRFPTRETMKYLAKDPLLFEPGTRWEYSLCHDVLAALVEVISGEKFEDFCRKYIFEPAGMSRTTLMLPEEEIDTITPQYTLRDGKPVRIRRHIWNYKLGSEYASGGAGGISTVEDYIRFMECFRKGEYIKQETIEMIKTDKLTEEQMAPYRAKYGQSHDYGLGMRVPRGQNHFRDFGWGGAAGAYLAFDTEREMTLYFGMHVLPPSDILKALRGQLYRIAAAELFDPEDLTDIRDRLKKLLGYDLKIIGRR